MTFFSPQAASAPSRPALMIQGTSSDAGKSLLAAALCRVFTEDGFKVAPFKSQNMTSYAFITAAGHYMGAAQAVQAWACDLEPDERMNPVLLMPYSNVGSRVIVRGQDRGPMRVREYFAFKPKAFLAAQEAYNSLAAEVDVMILEGAGSPAEINLKPHDIVNMNMARYAGAKVLLVGDIDRGGVFASLYGTFQLFEPWEQDLLLGFAVNKFRGDASLLRPAFEEISRLTGKPFLGTIPYLPEHGLPEEDSLAGKLPPTDIAGQAPGLRAPENILRSLDKLAAEMRKYIALPEIYAALNLTPKGTVKS